MNYCKRITDKYIRIGEVQFINPDLFPPEANADSRVYYTEMLIDKNNAEALALVRSAIDAVREQPDDREPMYDGDEWGDYPGKYVLHATTSMPPRVCFVEHNRIRQAEGDRDFYSGCHGAAVLVFYHYTLHDVAGVHAAINAAVKTRDDDRI